MVKAGFLSRVCPFIWREDLHNMIKDTHEWRENPFHSRLYPGSLSCNKHGMMAPVLMIDLETDNISSGLDIFREQFLTGQLHSLPAASPTSFLPCSRTN